MIMEEVDFNLIIEKECNVDTLQTLNKHFTIESKILLYVNIRSLKANFNKLEVFVESLKSKPYIIVCAETWELDYHELYKLQGYKMYYNESKINKADGVVMYIKNELTESTKIVEIDALKILHTSITLENRKSLNVSAVYRSHDMPKADFTFSIKKYLSCNRNISNHFLVGDFNIDILNKNITCDKTYENIMALEFLNNLLENEYTPCFTGITRPSNDNLRGTCIDNVYQKTTSINIKSYKLNNPFNDHFPLFITFDNIKDKKVVKEDYKMINYKKLENIAGNYRWNSLLSMQDPEFVVEEFIKIVQSCIEKSTVTNTKKVKSNLKTPRKKWITSAILVSCGTKELLYNQWKKNPSSVELKNEYKKYVKILDKVILDAKIKYERDLFKASSGNTKKLWKEINNKLGKNSKKENTINYIIHNDSKIEKVTDIADAMNNFFCEIGSNLSKRIKQPKNKKLKLPERNSNTIFIAPTDRTEIQKIIDEMKEKAGGVDSINSKSLKTISNHIAKPLEHIFNLCIEKSIWPKQLKSAEVVPIFKAGDKSCISNYRPISLISNIAKIFEKIIHNRMVIFLQKYNIISDYQFGFIKNRGTTEALNHITNNIVNQLDKSKPIIAVFLDLAKAFDTVNHNILLQKLDMYGIRGNALNLISSYLSNRCQKVKIQQHLSDSREITTGVPQGTILGPLFFILYVNDLLDQMPKESIMSYADDTVLMTSENTWTSAQDRMNEYLYEVSNWLAFNKLSLNVNKTVYITFGNYCTSVPNTLNITIQDQTVTRVECHKYLGVLFDYNLKWDKHINDIIKRTKYLIFVFAKLRKTMDPKSLVIIYYALFHSIINYGIIAWGGAYKNNLNLLQRQQTRILKVIDKNFALGHKYPLTIRQLFILESLMFYYEKLKTMYVNVERNTRFKNIQIPKLKRTISEKNSYVVAIKTFNMMPDELKKLNCNKRTMKKKLKDFLI